MVSPPRKAAFVLAATDHGSMIVSRLDFASNAAGDTWGVGYQILESSVYETTEIQQLSALLERRRAHFGDGVVVLDCGANFGVHSLEWAKQTTGWGEVLAIEAQERVFYALAGNIALNNCLNARALNAAVGNRVGTIRVPVPDYLQAANLGGLEMRHTGANEPIGQVIDYSEAATREIRLLSIDSLALARADVIKIDVEGMELDVLDGATETIAVHHPIIAVEYIKVGWEPLAARLTGHGYRLFRTPMNMICIHETDPTVHEVRAV